MLETSKDDARSLDELHATIQMRVGTAVAALQLLTAAAPFCDPLLAEIQEDLKAALEAAFAARRLTAELTHRLARVSSRRANAGCGS